MNTDKGTIVGEACTYRLIDLFDDLAGRMHTYGPNAVISFTKTGWHVEDRKAGPTERRLVGMVSDLVYALKEFKPETKVAIVDAKGTMQFFNT